MNYTDHNFATKSKSFKMHYQTVCKIRQLSSNCFRKAMKNHEQLMIVHVCHTKDRNVGSGMSLDEWMVYCYKIKTSTKYKCGIVGNRLNMTEHL